MNTTIDIEWVQTDERQEGHDDASWYIYNSNSDLVCRLSNGVKSIQVRADGEMRIHVVDACDELVGVIRWCDQFREYGITTDDQLIEIVFGGNEHIMPNGEKVHFDVVNNPWFDAYDDNVGDHLDMLSFSLAEIIAQVSDTLHKPEWLIY